jgi:hypothetical protein
MYSLNSTGSWILLAYMVMERQKRYLSVSPEAVSDTRGQFKLLSKLDLRGGLIDTKCERIFS